MIGDGGRAHDVRTHGTGTKRFADPEVGELVLAYEEPAITAEPGLALLVSTAEPGGSAPPPHYGARTLSGTASPRRSGSEVRRRGWVGRLSGSSTGIG
ncbi:MmyB family transcriptional regulator [Pseudonocardia oceani]|uniref:MmyB family transcriptional regulator n=1 Tax=Pseudonocardia oceani TaxID=2792013 RepID=UPI001C4A1F38|nr:hypothetical protein [Pseudonocardia oceani]